MKRGLGFYFFANEGLDANFLYSTTNSEDSQFFFSL